MEETLNLEDILEVIKKNFLMIAIMTLLFGCITAYGTIFLMTPQYEAKTQILVSQAQETEVVNNQDIQASLQLINTYRDIIKSPTVLDDVVNNLELQESSSAISNKIEVTNQDQSQVLTVTVTDESAQRAEDIANEVAAVFQSTVPEVMNVDNVSVLAAADIGENPSPVSPQPVINIAIGLILGLLIGLGIAFLRAFMDKRVQTEEDVEKYLELPVLGTVARFKK
ncbi:Capsular polysaccharide type 8 biosynthesis protein cap8A [Jeotgalicoccus aerolatus]|uniref:Capsular polysaccharide biosynthesis protein n=1 Tax=Jeotgalicoccus aerolatus TaxID=709510 RepID=A0ABS4HLV6_9STAP|nr:Wzz/FepE/Etk N-terminal domain-containing protein [Jeotgalicoccus aerolatus]MBP1951911.1 capsular polysaccharide biosynthesis protein [Jeotgalicoccus aerolatus]GGD93786.1 capsular polysaccharide biosynthesis protein [Jeotgalicoccus aerolatus]CAD2074879.1 Capsular polysaccharide type 8 biosynthesis protein cap8A [Jeotgalicoccus aerolatus]